MKNIGVFFGSRAPEHDVSIITAQLIIATLKDLDHNPIPIYISKSGRWYIGKQLDSIIFFRDPDKEKKLSKMKEYTLEPEAETDKMIFHPRGLFGRKVEIDLAFPALHGLNGEDGTMQGLYELFNIPYIGCDVASSAIAMDKVLTKMFFQSIAIPTPDFIYFRQFDWTQNQNKILERVKNKLKFPLMVKPARLGSSIGMQKVKDENSLKDAIAVALHYDNKVLIENCITDMKDITCSVIGDDKLEASLLQESLFKDELFSYDDKYLNNGGAQLGKATSNLVIPASLDEAMTRKVQSLSKTIFKELGCAGIARFDWLYDNTRRDIYAIEINPLPGTLYHHLWEKSGVPIKKLLTRLIDLAEERHREKQKLTSVFESDILAQASSAKLKFKAEK